ncbi:MAG: hypothetical protein V3V55_06130, partial [Rhodospirillales bacterium]
TSKQIGYPPLKILGGGTRIGRRSNWPANHDVVGSVEKRLFHINSPFLIVIRPIFDRPDAGYDNQKIIHTPLITKSIAF